MVQSGTYSCRNMRTLQSVSIVRLQADLECISYNTLHVIRTVCRGVAATYGHRCPPTVQWRLKSSVRISRARRTTIGQEAPAMRKHGYRRLRRPTTHPPCQTSRRVYPALNAIIESASLLLLPPSQRTPVSDVLLANGVYPTLIIRYRHPS